MSEIPNLQIVSYNLEVKVKYSDAVATIVASLPDWVPDFEALSIIGNHYGDGGAICDRTIDSSEIIS